MELSEIKSRLTLAQVLQHYNLKSDKNLRLHCPFHEDKTPSLQVYYKTHTAYCFSSNCKTHGKSMDVIDFIMHKENTDKHNALLKCIEIIQYFEGKVSHQQKPIEVTTATAQLTTGREQFLGNMFTYFRNAISNSKPARDYLQSRNIDPVKIETGYNTAQFHHGTRKDDELINNCVAVGLLAPWGTNTRQGGQAFKPFAKYCIVFALRNKAAQITGLYFRSTENNTGQKHFYLKDSTGLYPEYPAPDTEKLIIAESVIDTASLLQIKTIADEYSLLAAYGTNRLNDEMQTAIKELQQLKEIIFAFDNDEAGNKAAAKYKEELQTLLPQVRFTKIILPNKDVNETLQAHDEEIFLHLLNERTTDFFLSSRLLSGEKENEPPAAVKTKQLKTKEPQQGAFNTDNPHNLFYKGKAADYYIKGGLRGQLDSLKVSVQVVERKSRLDIRAKADLYEHKQAESLVKTVSDKLGIENHLLESDLSSLTQLLEIYRNENIQERKNKTAKAIVKLPEATVTQCIQFLERDNLVQKINELIGKSGVTGEEKNRLCLFAIASSYKMQDTLHALIQGSSGSGKTRLLKTICELMPQEDTIKFTRVTDSSFYNYPEDYLVNKLLGFEDIDGLKEDALYAVRELISNEILVSSTTTKTEDGQLMSAERTVRGPIASLSCTTKGEIYEDNMSRVFLIAVDESKEQTRKIISYQQRKAAGLIDYEKESQVKEFLQNCIRLLKPYSVINPYAEKIQLPEEAHKIRRLNDLYLSFVKQVTLLNQYRRKKDGKGRLISTIEDLQTANDILFESIVLKVDELDGSLRQFYEALKQYVSKQNQDNSFELREVRQALHISKTRLHRYIHDLTELAYIQQTGGYANKGYQYKILYWDNIEAIRGRIKNQLQNQIATLSTAENKPVFQHNGTLHGTL